MDRPLQLAAALREAGARFTVVGGAARPGHRPRDLDVLVAPADVPSLAAALASIGSVLPPLRSSPVAVTTSYGPLDVFVG